MTVDTLPADPQAALRDLFGFAAFRPGQEQVVRAVLDGDDVLAVMPTGAGKSLCYQLPAMLLPACTVVISPLVALMKDQVDSLPPALRERAALFNSAIERDELDAGMADLAAGRLKLVYVAPERLRQRRFIHALQRAAISRFVIDEAHCISLWGHDFRPDYFFIPAVLEALGDPPVLAMTATATRPCATNYAPASAGRCASSTPACCGRTSRWRSSGPRPGGR
ncbi:MAG: DEAD/DEAH box helicase [Dehalococcoidia bacterium]